MHAQSYSCPTLCGSMDCGSPGFSVHEISQGRIQEWVAIFSDRDLPDPGFEPASPALKSGFFTMEPPGKPQFNYIHAFNFLGYFRVCFFFGCSIKSIGLGIRSPVLLFQTD